MTCARCWKKEVVGTGDCPAPAKTEAATTPAQPGEVVRVSAASVVVVPPWYPAEAATAEGLESRL